MKLHFQHFGAGFPLVILHGLFGSSDNWQSLSKRLAQHFDVYALDLRNHGNSPHADEFDYATMAEDVREFLSTHGISRAHVMGHSMGGKVAMQFALTFPTLVEKLVIVDIAPKRYAPTHAAIFDALLKTDPSAFTNRSAVDQFLSASIPDIATRQFLLKNLGSTESGFLKWKINLPSLHQHYGEVLEAPSAAGTFSGPTLFIRGGKSDYIKTEDDSLIHSQFPNARIITIPEADHWVHADAPNEFLQAVLSFLHS